MKFNEMSPADQQSAINTVQHRYGLVNMPGPLRGFITEALLASDALPTLLTTNNSGIPAFLTNYIDPTVIEVVVAPMKMATILGEEKKGDWTTKTAQFPIAESAGEVSSYSDHSNNGRVTGNVNWTPRQSYGYQSVSSYGEQELAMMGVAGINWVNSLNRSQALIMNKFQNKTYAYGVAGLQLYGVLNDPSLSAPIAPGIKAKGGYTWIAANGTPNATANEVYNDVVKLVQTLIKQSGGVVEKDAAMQLCMSPGASVALTFTNEFNVNVGDLLQKNYPKLRIVTAVEYATASGEMVQLIADAIDGQPVGNCAFTEKMRAHAIIPALSSWEQKKSGGTWGAIIKQPVAIVAMLGL